MNRLVRASLQRASRRHGVVLLQRCLNSTQGAHTTAPLTAEPVLQQEKSPVAGTASTGPEEDASGWREPLLTDLDRSIPQVDCAFVGDLIRARTARLAQHRKEQNAVLEKMIAHQNAKTAVSRRAESIAAMVQKADESDLIANGVITAAEWETYAHARPEYDDGYLLIDCRTVNEITSWGMIEGAKVLPAHEMFEAFKLTPDDFQAEFGFPKPHPEQKIIFYCQFGPRSLMAAQILSWLGYPRVLHLREGYHEWAKQYNALLKRWFDHDRTSQNDLHRLAAFEAAKQLQREIAPEFNELPMLEAERLVIDETRSRGTLKVGDGLRETCYREVESLAAGITPEDIKLPPSVSERLAALGTTTLLPGDESAVQGSNNARMSSKGITDYFSGLTGVRDERDSHPHKVGVQAAAASRDITDDCPVNDFSTEAPSINKDASPTTQMPTPHQSVRAMNTKRR